MGSVLSERIREQLEQKPWLPAVLLAIAVLPVKLYGLEVSYFNIHAARDWERGWQMFHGVKFWTHGPELLFRGSIPGWFFNFLTGLFQFPTRNLYFGAMGPPILFAISVGFFYDALRRLYGSKAALIATLYYGLFPLGTIFLRYLWNPAYLYLFTAFAFWCLARAETERRPGFLAAGIIALMMAAQIHLTGYTAIVAFLAGMMIIRLAPTWKHWLIVAGAALLFYAPYVIDQAMNYWPDAAAMSFTTQDQKISMFRVAVNDTFFLPFATHLIPQPHLEPLGIERTFPFSYFERFYEADPVYMSLGMMAAVLGIPPALMMIGAILTPFSWMRRKDLRSAGRLTAAAFLWIVICCIPQILWNPGVEYLPEEKFPVPTRYFIICWPMQFVLLAAALRWIEGRAPIYHLWYWFGPLCAVCLLLTVLFHLRAQRSGEPFHYTLISSWPVHTLRDKTDLAYYMVENHGVTEEVLLTRVRAEGTMLLLTEESIDFELRAALEDIPDHPENHPGHWYFIHRTVNKERITGEYEVIDRAEFGAISLLVYRPLIDMSQFEADAPISWWWY